MERNHVSIKSIHSQSVDQETNQALQGDQAWLLVTYVVVGTIDFISVCRSTHQ
ncbi:hypothetical protein THOD03_20277 [Vibrio harveyi]|nr:hypothetical protein TH15OA1_530120 [Vibrio harveyi]CAH1556420.1 hypothetical protein THOD03_20277 [Vibrio harveyi]